MVETRRTVEAEGWDTGGVFEKLVEGARDERGSWLHTDAQVEELRGITKNSNGDLDRIRAMLKGTRLPVGLDTVISSLKREKTKEQTEAILDQLLAENDPGDSIQSFLILLRRLVKSISHDATKDLETVEICEKSVRAKKITSVEDLHDALIQGGQQFEGLDFSLIYMALFNKWVELGRAQEEVRKKIVIFRGAALYSTFQGRTNKHPGLMAGS